LRWLNKLIYRLNPLGSGQWSTAHLTELQTLFSLADGEKVENQKGK